MAATGILVVKGWVLNQAHWPRRRYASVGARTMRTIAQPLRRKTMDYQELRILASAHRNYGPTFRSEARDVRTLGRGWLGRPAPGVLSRRLRADGLTRNPCLLSAFRCRRRGYLRGGGRAAAPAEDIARRLTGSYLKPKASDGAAIDLRQTPGGGLVNEHRTIARC